MTTHGRPRFRSTFLGGHMRHGAAAQGPASTSGGGGSGVSSGAAAGIGIGCVVAGALLGALAMAVYAKKRRGLWQPHLDERPLDSAREPSNGFKI